MSYAYRLKRKEQVVSCATRRKPGQTSRRKPVGFRYKRLFTFLGLAAIVALVFLLSRQDVFERLTATDMQRIDIEGNRALSRQELVRQLGIEQGQRVTRRMRQEATQRLLGHPRVTQASLSLNLRGELKVLVEERLPAYKIENPDGVYVVDSYGMLLGELRPQDEKLALIQLIGDFTPTAFKRAETSGLVAGLSAIIQSLQGRKAIGRVHVAQFVSDEGWRVWSSHWPFPIIIGHRLDDLRVSRLQRVLRDLEDDVARIESIDIDFSDRVVVRLKDESSVERDVHGAQG